MKRVFVIRMGEYVSFRTASQPPIRKVDEIPPMGLKWVSFKGGRFICAIPYSKFLRRVTARLGRLPDGTMLELPERHAQKIVDREWRRKWLGK